MILIVANLARGDYESVRALLDDSKKLRLKALELYEIILQSYLFLGYPKAIEGLRLLKERYPQFRPPELAELSDRSAGVWRKRGEKLCRVVYGGNYEALRQKISTLSPDLDDWMIWEGYGKVLSRDGVPPELRELCTCAALAVTGDFVQLHSHMIGAVHTGATIELIREMLLVVDGVARPDRLEEATGILARVSQKVGRDA
jgi:4-carboxymuconolactone decarboxylase